MNRKCRMHGLMLFWAVLKIIYRKKGGLTVPVTIVWVEALSLISHIWGELGSLQVVGWICYEPVIHIYYTHICVCACVNMCVYTHTHTQWYIWFSSGFSDKNEKFNLYDVIIFDAHWVTCFILWHQYSSAQSFLSHINFTRVFFFFLSGWQIQVSCFFFFP